MGPTEPYGQSSHHQIVRLDGAIRGNERYGRGSLVASNREGGWVAVGAGAREDGEGSVADKACRCRVEGGPEREVESSRCNVRSWQVAVVVSQ